MTENKSVLNVYKYYQRKDSSISSCFKYLSMQLVISRWNFENMTAFVLVIQTVTVVFANLIFYFNAKVAVKTKRVGLQSVTSHIVVLKLSGKKGDSLTYSTDQENEVTKMFISSREPSVVLAGYNLGYPYIFLRENLYICWCPP